MVGEQRTYYESERRVAADPSDPRHILPTFPHGARVLDVGCGAGWDGQQVGTSLFVGIDPSPEAIAYRREVDPTGRSVEGRGEDLHRYFAARSFTFVFGRVSLPYMDANAFLAEAYRVLEPGGKLWLTYHDVRIPLKELRKSVRDRNLRGVLYRLYVLLNGVAFHLWGGQYRYPLKRSRFSSFQTRAGMRRALARAGFVDVRFPEAGMHLLVTAEKPPSPPWERSGGLRPTRSEAVL